MEQFTHYTIKHSKSFKSSEMSTKVVQKAQDENGRRKNAAKNLPKSSHFSLGTGTFFNLGRNIHDIFLPVVGP